MFILHTNENHISGRNDSRVSRSKLAWGQLLPLASDQSRRWTSHCYPFGFVYNESCSGSVLKGITFEHFGTAGRRGETYCICVDVKKIPCFYGIEPIVYSSLFQIQHVKIMSIAQLISHKCLIVSFN